MSVLDFNSADKQLSFECIPANTIVPLCMQIAPGGRGDGGWFTSSKSSDAVMLSCEFTVTEGPYFKRKVFQYFTLSGGKQNEKGESIGGNISRATLRAILESARNILPDDMSDTAVSKRRISGWQDFQGICFLAKIGIEKGKDNYPDKNRITMVITPDMKEYARVAPPAGGYAPAPAPSQAAAPAQATSPWGATPPPPPAAPSGNPAPSWAR
jgi:hypothetical protein